MLAQADKWSSASSYKQLVKAAIRGTLGVDLHSSPDKDRGQRRLRGSRHRRVCWPDGAWLEHHREAHCTPSWGCRAFQALGQGRSMGGLLAVASWVTWASPGAERRRRTWTGAGHTLNPGFDRCGAESEAEASNRAETEAQAQDLHRLWAVGRRRGWFGGQTHPHFPFVCEHVRLPQCCQNGGLLCPGPCPAPCHRSCLTGGGAWASQHCAGSCHSWQGGCAHRGGWNWAEGGKRQCACLVCIIYTLKN